MLHNQKQRNWAVVIAALVLLIEYAYLLKMQIDDVNQSTISNEFGGASIGYVADALFAIFNIGAAVLTYLFLLNRVQLRGSSALLLTLSAAIMFIPTFYILLLIHFPDRYFIQGLFAPYPIVAIGAFINKHMS